MFRWSITHDDQNFPLSYFCCVSVQSVGTPSPQNSSTPRVFCIRVLKACSRLAFSWLDIVGTLRNMLGSIAFNSPSLPIAANAVLKDSPATDTVH